MSQDIANLCIDESHYLFPEIYGVATAGTGEIRPVDFIRFKAQRKSDGKWVVGDLNRYIEAGKTHICNHYDIDGVLSEEKMAIHEVDSATACQYIGKWHKETHIFEKDLVLLAVKPGRDNAIYHVEWDPDTVGFVLNNGKIKLTFDALADVELEVIGNSIDDPDLWEKAKQ